MTKVEFKILNLIHIFFYILLFQTSAHALSCIELFSNGSLTVAENIKLSESSNDLLTYLKNLSQQYLSDQQIDKPYTVNDLSRRSFRVDTEVLLDRSILVEKRLSPVPQIDTKFLSIQNNLTSRNQQSNFPATLQFPELSLNLSTTNMRVVTYTPESSVGFAKKGADGESINQSFIAQDSQGYIYEVSKPVDLNSSKIFVDLYLQIELKKSGLNPNFLGVTKDLKGNYRMVFKLTADTSPKRFDAVEFGYFKTPFDITDPVSFNTLLQLELFLTRMKQLNPDFFSTSVNPSSIQSIDNLKSTTVFAAIASEIPFLISANGQLKVQGLLKSQNVSSTDWKDDNHPSRNYEYSPRSPYYIGSLSQTHNFSWWGRDTYLRAIFLLSSSPNVRSRYIAFLYQRNKKAWWDLFKNFEFWSNESTLIGSEFNAIFNEIKIQNIETERLQKQVENHANYTFSSKNAAKYHYKRHGESEFQSPNINDYEKVANEFIREPLDDFSILFKRKDGALIKVNFKSNEVAVFTLEGKLITYFKYDPSMHGEATSLEFALNEIERK